MKSTVQTTEDPQAASLLKPIVAAALITLASALILRSIGSIGGYAGATLLLALVGGRWAALGRLPGAGGAPAAFVALGCLLGAAAIFVEPAPAKGILLAAAILHGCAVARLTSLGRPQHVVAYNGLAVAVALAFGGMLALESTGRLQLSGSLETARTEAIDQWVDLVAESGIETAADATSESSEAASDLREQLETISSSQIAGSLVGLYVICFTLFGGYVMAGSSGRATFAAFQATERQAPFIILALAGEAVVHVLELPDIQPYTRTMLHAFGALVWLQALAVFLFFRMVGTRLQRAQLLIISGLGIALIILMPIAGALIGLFDIYFDFRKLNVPSGDNKT